MADSCCCCNLRAGGLIVGYIGLIINALVLYSSTFFEWFFFVMLISTLAVAAWLYGIYRSNLNAMLPEIVLAWTLSVALISVLILMPIMAVIGVQLVPYLIAAASDAAAVGYFVAWIVNFGIVVIWFIISIPTAFQFYFTTIKHSLYRLMKAAESAAPAHDTIEMSNITVP